MVNIEHSANVRRGEDENEKFIVLQIFGLELMTSQTVYHEKQVRELCALHALNNLFQEKDAFTKAYLDAICYNLSPDVWINPHKSILGLGNYDINVIMKALQDKNYSMIWFDKRKDPSCLNLTNILGFILNVPGDYKISFVTIPLRRRHWFAIREVNGLYFNLDSKLNKPIIIGKHPNLMEYLKEEIDDKDKQLFIIVHSEVDKNESWLLEQAGYSNNEDNKSEIIQIRDFSSEDFNVTFNPLCDSNN